MSYKDDQKDVNARIRKSCDDHIRKTKAKFILVYQEASTKSDEQCLEVFWRRRLDAINK